MIPPAPRPGLPSPSPAVTTAAPPSGWPWTGLSARPAVARDTGIVLSCVRAGRAGTPLQSLTVPNRDVPPPECAVTCSAAHPHSGSLAPGESALLSVAWDRRCAQSNASPTPGSRPASVWTTTARPPCSSAAANVT